MVRALSRRWSWTYASKLSMPRVHICEYVSFPSEKVYDASLGITRACFLGRPLSHMLLPIVMIPLMSPLLSLSSNMAIDDDDDVVVDVVCGGVTVGDVVDDVLISFSSSFCVVLSTK